MRVDHGGGDAAQREISRNVAAAHFVFEEATGDRQRCARQYRFAGGNLR